jgi:molybdopterin converting factor small subunit
MNVELPAILGDAIGSRSVEIDATTVSEALVALRQHPRLGPLIFDESATLRRHVLLFVNETDVRHLPSRETPLMPSDRLAIVQAVSGG